MLTGIGLRNFKAFGEGPNVLAVDEHGDLALTDTAPLSKITLIFGPNSGGKSSIIQALLLLKQSLSAGYGEDDRELVHRGDFVDLGGSRAMLHRHDKERKLGIFVKYKNLELGDRSAENDVHMTFLLERKDSDPFPIDCLSLAAVTYRITSNENDVPLLDAKLGPPYPRRFAKISVKVLDLDGERVSYPSDEEFLPILTFPELDSIRERVSSLGIQEPQMLDIDSLRRLEHMLARRRRVQERRRRVQALRRALTRAQGKVLRYYSLDSGKLNLSTEQILELTPENIPYDYERHLRMINYLGPLRSAPERIYRLSSESRLSSGLTGIQGEHSANVLYHNPRMRSQVNEWFDQLGIPYELNVLPIGEAPLAGEHIAIALTDRRTDTQVTISDVGYGINQLLPVIIEGLAPVDNSIICVEQPEIHIHPRLQANVADFMIDTIADEPGKRKQWIVETHSELLVRRLQTRIAQGDISPADVSILYVDPDDNNSEGSAIKQLQMDENGYWLDEWPRGFFDDGYIQTRIARLARRARRHANASEVRN